MHARRPGVSGILVFATTIAMFSPWVVNATDPDLEPGFPVLLPSTPGSYTGGQAIHVLVTNLDANPDLEIVLTGLAQGPLWAFHHDGALVRGWPVGVGTAAYPAAGPLIEGGGTGVAIGFSNGTLAVVDGAGVLQSGWPRRAANYIGAPPSVYAPPGAEMAQVFTEEEDWSLHGYSAQGEELPGWPHHEFVGGQAFATPAIGNLDSDPEPELVSGTDGYLFAYHLDGKTVQGFPVNIPWIFRAFPAIGDLDGDGTNEIVIATSHDVHIVQGDGSEQAVLPFYGTPLYWTVPALADIDMDGRLDIIVQTNQYLNVFTLDGDLIPGFPIYFGDSWWVGYSSPVVGDLDGDLSPDIAITVERAGRPYGEVRAYAADASMLRGFPKPLPLGSGAVPAIADIDLDGRNELIVAGHGPPQLEDIPAIWVYDLHGEQYGGIEWGQLMHDAAHTGFYQRRAPTPILVQDLQVARADNGGVQVRWRIAAALRARLSGQRVSRAANATGPFATVSPLLPPGVTTFVDASAPVYCVWYRLEVMLLDGSTETTSALPARRSSTGPAELTLVDGVGSDQVAIRYALGSWRGPYAVGVYNVAGRLVRSVASGIGDSGMHWTRWDGSGDSGVRAPRGVYFVTLRAGATVLSRKLPIVARITGE